jgi:dihydroxyacetone kinase-like protein
LGDLPGAPPSARSLTAAFEAAVAAVAGESRARPGDKTMLDALRPAADALRVAVEAGEDLATGLERAAAAARVGMEASAAMPGVFGRAGELGEAVIGHRDPGATSAYLIVQALALSARGQVATAEAGG